MSNPTESITPLLVRDENELEGSLLPVAHAINEASASNATAAVPLTTFEYETAIVEEQNQQEDFQPTAYSIPSLNRDAIADDSKSRVKLAERMGRMAAEAEREAIQQANRRVFSQEYYAKQAVETANDVAKQRDLMGLEVPPPPQPSTKDATTTSQPIGRETKPRCHGGGGYDVNDYSIGTKYETSDYQVSEYKSVYD